MNGKPIIKISESILVCSFLPSSYAISWQFMGFCTGLLTILYRSKLVSGSARHRSTFYVECYHGELSIDVARIITSVIISRDDSTASVYTHSEPASTAPQNGVLFIFKSGNKALSSAKICL